MITVLVPLGGKSIFFEDSHYKYPKSLIEIFEKPMIQHVVENLGTIKDDIRFVFIINREDNQKYHLEDVLKLITNDKCDVVVLSGTTQGACCTTLMAIDKINKNNELIIANSDQIISEDLNEIISFFRSENSDAGVAVFDAVHPRWAFARIEGDNVIETAEKKPLSRDAIAGFYYYKKAQEYIDSAMKSIIKDATMDGLYYIAPVLNEMILANKKVVYRRIDSKNYYTFNTPEKVKNYIEKNKV